MNQTLGYCKGKPVLTDMVKAMEPQGLQSTLLNPVSHNDVALFVDLMTAPGV
jgi:hypothetical protein